MSRGVSQTFRDAFLQLRTDETVLMLLTINHSSLVEPIRLVLNTVSVVSQGNTFLPFFFEVTLPDERPDRAPTVSLSIDAVDRTIVAAVRALVDAPTVKLQVALASDPDTIEIETPDLLWRVATYSMMRLEGTIEGPAVFNQRFPRATFSPAFFPGIFKGI